jgi:hypothetical protein
LFEISLEHIDFGYNLRIISNKTIPNLAKKQKPAFETALKTGLNERKRPLTWRPASIFLENQAILIFPDQYSLILQFKGILPTSFHRSKSLIYKSTENCSIST